MIKGSKLINVLHAILNHMTLNQNLMLQCLKKQKGQDFLYEQNRGSRTTMLQVLTVFIQKVLQDIKNYS